MPIQEARSHLRRYNLEDRIREFSVSSATVALAAEAVGVIPARIAKTLSFKLDDRVILVVVAGDARIDNVKYKARFCGKAKMLTPEEAVTRVGHEVGGVCPFGIKEDVEVYLDKSLQRFDVVYPAAGTGASAVELSCDELFECARALDWVDVCKDWEDTDEQ